MKKWVKLPTYWIVPKDGGGIPEERTLKAMKWAQGEGSGHIAALMLLIAIAHHVNDEPDRHTPEVGIATLSYPDFAEITGLSRAKIAQGLFFLELFQLIERVPGTQSSIKLVRYEERFPWGMLPALGLYDSKVSYIRAFRDFKLRQKVELHALKFYLLAVALRNNRTNMAAMSFDTIEKYTGIHRSDITSAKSLLIAHGLLYEIESYNPTEHGIRKGYRLTHLDPRRHGGTAPRERLADAFTSLIDD